MDYSGIEKCTEKAPAEEPIEETKVQNTETPEEASAESAVEVTYQKSHRYSR